jgi:hypothetical protein
MNLEIACPSSDRAGLGSAKWISTAGILYFPHKNGRIAEEWTLCDEMSLLMQVKQAQMESSLV